MIRVFLGDDDFSRIRALNRAVDSALGARKDDPLARQVLYAGDSSFPDVAAKVVEFCSSISMFSPELAVVLRRVEALKAVDQEYLSKWLLTKPECLLFIDGAKIDGRSEFSKVLAKVCKIEKFEPPKDYKMAEWITNHCREEFSRPIQPEAAKYLADAIGDELSVLHSEIEKLLTAVPDTKTISFDLVSRLIVPQRILVPWEIQKSFGDRDPKAFTQMLRRLLDQGIDPIPITSNLFTHAVKLMHTQTMIAEKRSADEIAKALGLQTFLYNIQNLPTQASKWTPAVLSRVIQRLGEIYFGLKASAYANDAEFELAVCALVVR
jgi:DNA polymerase-3 subunit delta